MVQKTPRLCALMLAGLVAAASLASPLRAETLRGLTGVQFVRNVPVGAQLKVALELGIRNVRIGLRWGDVEKEKGKYDWRATDEKMRPILGTKMRPIVTLFGSNGAYPGAEGEKQGGVGGSPEAIEGFARFSAAVAKRYGPGDPARPIVYEIWNEPNTKTFWGVVPNPEGYAALATAVCAAIRESVPGATVVGLSTEGTPVKKPYFPPNYGIDIYQEWSNRALTPDLAACIDGISIHPYRPVPETYLSEEPDLQAYLGTHWKKEKPPLVVNSEWGYHLDPKTGDPEAAQAALVVRLLLLGAGQGRLTTIYQAMNGGRDANDKDSSYGLFLFMGKSKASGDAIKRLLAAIGDYEIKGIDATSDGIYRFDAAGAGGEAAAVIWASGEQNYTVPEALAGATAIDLTTGAKSPAGSEIAISPKPILLLKAP